MTRKFVRFIGRRRTMKWWICTALSLGGAAAAQSPGVDPLEHYYGNTLICGASVTGEDACHQWMERNGTTHGGTALRGKSSGTFKVGPRRPDGEVPVCYSQDKRAKPSPALPAEIKLPPSRMKDPNAGTVAICSNKDFYTTCRHVPRKDLTDQQVAAAMEWRQNNPVCYPLGYHEVGDVWFEKDDPLPTQDGLDKLWLIRGHM